MSSSDLATSATATEGIGLAGAFRNSLGCAMLTVNEQRRITSFSPEAENLMRLNARQVVGQPLKVLPAPLQKVIRETFSTGRPVTNRQIVLNPVQHGDIPVRANTAAVRTENGKGLFVIAVLCDLTAVEKLEQNLQRLERLASIGMLSSSMAHEIKNALVAVKTFVDLLLEKNRDAELAELVRREMRRVDTIVSQMMKFACQPKPAFGVTHVHELLDQSLRMIQHQLEGKLVTMRCSYTASPDLIKGNAYQLQQAFVNLFLNAADAVGPNGELSIATEVVSVAPRSPHEPRPRKRPHLRVAIKDTGVGVAPENVSRLFEPFFTTKKNGTGLGLAITHRIIQEHHGSINVESQINKGTTFNILLPLLEKTR
jgi:PAS domain S-box-containing protein